MRGREEIKMNTVIDRYVETILAPYLVDLGVVHLPGALVAVISDIRLRLQSVLAHWQELPTRKTLLFIGREEGMFYQPELAPLDIRALVVVAIRNSLLEDLGSSGSSLLPPDLHRSNWPVKDDNIRFITQEAIVYWQQVDLEHLSLPPSPPSQDTFGNLKQDFPHAWHVLSRLAQAKTQTISFSASQAPLPTLPVSSIAIDKPKQTRVESGINPRFDSHHIDFLRAIQDAARVQKKPIYERSNGSCELAQLLNARSTSGLANAWGPFVDQSYPQIPRTRQINNLQSCQYLI